LSLFFLLLVLAFLCELAGTVGGFGSSVFFVPLAGLFYSLHEVLILTALLHVSGNLSKMILFRKYINWKTSVLFGLPGIVAVAIGAILISRFDIVFGEIVLSVFLLSFSAFLFFNPEWKAPKGKRYALAWAVIAGFLAGLIGTGGAIRGAAMTAYHFSKNVFVATSATIDMGVDLTRTLIYLNNGFLNAEHIPYIPALMGISFLGSWTGKQLLEKISQDVFRKIVLLLIFITGMITLFKSLSMLFHG
jgi:uncharacterized membrane protein YfcA